MKIYFGDTRGGGGVSYEAQALYKRRILRYGYQYYDEKKKKWVYLERNLILKGIKHGIF